MIAIRRCGLPEAFLGLLLEGWLGAVSGCGAPDDGCDKEKTRTSIWVAEPHRLVRFNGDGSERVQEGRQARFVRPKRIAAATDGGYWITQQGRSLVRTDAAFEVSWTSPPGVLEDPYDVVVDRAGLWVSDRYRHRVLRLDPSGNALCEASGPLYAGDLAAGKGEQVWVRDGFDGADIARTNIYLFDGDCSQSVAPVQLNTVTGLTADRFGGVWVTDLGLKAVLHINEVGEIVADSSKVVPAVKLDRPECLTLDASGKVWVGDRGAGSIVVLNPADLSIVADSGSASFALPRRLVPAEDGSVWLILDNGEQIRRLRLNGAKIETVISMTPWIVGQRSDVLPLSDGSALIVDNTFDQILKVSGSGEVLLETDSGDFGYVWDVAAGPAGRLWVADFAHPKLVQFDRDGVQLQEFTHQYLKGPSYLLVAADESVWVADKVTLHLMLISAEGAVKTDLSTGMTVSSMTLHSDGTSAWVFFEWGNQIWLVDNTGQIQRTFKGPAVWDKPAVGAFDPVSANLWIVDESLKLVRIDTEGNAVDVFGGPFHLAIAPAAGGGAWVSFDSAGGSPVLRLGTDGQGVARSGFYAVHEESRLLPSANGGVFAVSSAYDYVLWFDANAKEIRHLGGGDLHRPVTVVETK